MKVLVTTTSFQDTPGRHHDALKELNYNVDFLRGPLDESGLIDIIHLYDGVICGDDEYTERVIVNGVRGRLKVLSKYGVGLDRIDLASADEHGVIVTNVPGLNHVSVAEHALALLFTFQKNIHIQYNSVNEGQWNRLIGHEIQGKTIGVFGLGSVGKELALKSLALGMKVIAHDINHDADFFNENKRIEYVDNVNELYSRSDVISLHLPHNEMTHEIINEDVVSKKMHRSPVLINTSRGKIVSTNAVINALESGFLSGYLTDVLSQEPVRTDEKLLRLPKVIITPHVGSRTFENVERQGLVAIDNLRKSLNSFE